jgi:hypothetical protein
MMQNFMEPYSNNMALKAKKNNSPNPSENEYIYATHAKPNLVLQLTPAALSRRGIFIQSPGNH